MSGEKAELTPLKQAFLAVQSLQRKVDELQAARSEPLAVIGLACRFPGADSVERYWELLAGGVDAISERPGNRWRDDHVDENDEAGARASRWGGFLPSIDTFDPQFFGIAPREAASMDPQQRLFLEVCWEALESAGIAPDRLKGQPVGVYAGVCTNDYSALQTREGDISSLGSHYASGIAHSIVPGRVSYLLGLTGPSVTLDTACSSSLVAVHLACQALRGGDCDMAIAGGVNAILLPDNAVAFSRTGMMAADGRCKVFDAVADGFVRGEGCGVVVLKRLSKAEADGDPIQAVIRGSAVNQDGASTGLTAPSGRAQEAVITAAVRAAGVQPDEISYVEAHGTGTVLGDPIEVQAIGAALGAGRKAENALLVGSVKSNFGHLEASAGVAGLIKVILAVQHGAIPPSLHFRTPNPLVPWERLQLRVATELTPWGSRPRLAGVSSFGFGGTNAHVVVGEAPETARVSADGPDRPQHVLTFSSPTATGLRAVARRYAEHIGAHPEQGLPDVAHTASAGRAQFRHRAAVVFDPRDDLAGRLRAFAEGGEASGVQSRQINRADAPPAVFLFSGQGSQYPGMGRRLFETQPVFRRALTECASLLADEMRPGILDVIYPSGGDARLLDQTAYTQPALFAFEYALAALWQSWGVTPGAVMGHSLGEYVAATVAGVLRLEDALRLVALRGRLSQRAGNGGAMASVLADADRVRAVLATLGDPAEIAAINAPESTVISGPREGVGAATRALAAQGVEVKPLAISGAFHSAAVEPLLEEFGAAASRVSYGLQIIPLFSNLVGRRAQPGEASNAAYWVRHLRQPVLFAAGFRAVVEGGFSTFLEVGPHTTLLGLGRQAFPNGPGAWLPSLRRDYDDWTTLLGSLVHLYLDGAPIDWAAFDRGYARRRVVLPSYPFERQRCWVAPSRTVRSGRRSVGTRHPLLGRQVSSAFLSDTVFETILAPESFPWLPDHKVMDATVLPTTAYLEAAWEAGVAVYGGAICAIEDVDIHDALVIPEAQSRTMQIAVSRAESGRATFKVVSADGGNDGSPTSWRSHASGRVSLRPVPDSGQWTSLGALQSRCSRTVDISRVGEALTARGIVLGPSFQGLLTLTKGDGEALGRIRSPGELESQLSIYQIHPAVLDAALQVVSAAFLSEDELTSEGEAYLPVAVERFRLLRPPHGELWGHAVMRPRQAVESPIADVRMYDGAGEAVAEVLGLQLRRVGVPKWAKNERAAVGDLLYDVEWRAVPSTGLPPAAAHSWLSPAPAETAHTLSPSVADHAARSRMEQYGSALQALDPACTAVVVDALRRLGWRIERGDRVEARELAARLGVAESHRRLFSRLLSILAEDGILARDGERWMVKREPAPANVEPTIESLRARFPEAAAELGLLSRTAPALPACLTGRADPLALLFPGGRFDAADELYRKSPPAVMLNALAREVVRTLVGSAPGQAPVRALEIGAGTGGTTSFVLPVLPPGRAEYVFTDVSPLFLARAKESLQAFPFVEYRTLDIEKAPSVQGFDTERFDLVIAANVLHATRDLAETLVHVRQLVRPGGTLLLLEGTRPQRWIDLTFGLTDGWWRFEDRRVRPDYPLVGRSEWADLLTAAGFEDVAALPAEGCGEILEQNLLLIARAPATTRKRWIVFADATSAPSLVAGLRSEGVEVLTVTPGTAFARDGEGFEVPPRDGASYRRLLEAAVADGAAPIAGVVHLWSLDGGMGDDGSLADLRSEQDRGCRSVLHLVQALAACPSTTSARLVLVTRGAQPVRPGELCVPAHAPVWGLARTTRLEQPDLDCMTVDLDPGASLPAADLAARVLSRGEPEWAEREGTWYVARLVRHASAAASSLPASAESVALVNTTPGSLDGLQYVAAERVPPGPGEVEIRVTMSALNFRDVLVAMDLYPGLSGPTRLGGECAGEIWAVGAGVTNFSRGDQVVAMAPGGFGSHVIARADLVVPKPPGLTLEQAVTLPSAFLTAWHALYDLAGLRQGESVLIHAGAGGVGLAAIRLAQRVGARVFATAGSPEKRAYLASAGVEQVMDSRSRSYAEEILERTGGQGVDVVLNSLADDHIAHSLRAFAAEGRFVELGKRGIWSAEQVRNVRPAVRYFVVDLAATGTASPEAVGSVLRKVFQAVADGEIKPLPATTFASGDVVGAFRYMAQARHIGKIVVRHDAGQRACNVWRHGTYLITGGLGGLGLVTARWLVEKGAGHVVLMSRHVADQKAEETLAELNRGGPRVSAFPGDVGREEDVRRVLDLIANRLPRLRGVIHAAGTLRDGILLSQAWEDFSATFGPKIDGTWHLHQLTRDAGLDFFVLFSSISALFGSAGQGNHAAANAFMDCLAHRRRASGLPATSIDWGGWAEVGAALQHDVAGRMAAQGMGTIAPAVGLAALERLLQDDATQAAVMPVKWEQFSRQFGQGRLQSSFLAELAPVARQPAPGPRKEATRTVLPVQEAPLRDAAPSVRWERLLQRMRALAAKVLGLESTATLDPDRPLQEMGLDSLMAVELRNLMKSELGLERAPAATVVFDHPTVQALTEFVGCDMFGWPSRQPQASGERREEESVLDRLEKLSSAEVEQLLSDRMKGAL